MKRTTAFLGALFLIVLLCVGFSFAEPINASPAMISEQDDYGIKTFSTNLVTDFDDEDDDEDTDEDDDDEDETDDEDEDETDDDNDDDDDTDDAEQEVTKNEAADKIEEAEDKISEVEDEIEDAKTAGDVSQGAINGAEGKLTSAKNQLDNANNQFDNDHYKQAYEKAEDAIEKCEDALEHLEEKNTGNHTDDVDDEESVEEETAERNLKVTVLINDQDATGTSEETPLQVSGDVVIKVTIENDGPPILIDEVKIETSSAGVQVSSFALSGATLSSGTSVEFTNTVDTGLIGTLAEILTDPVYQTEISIEMEDDWDYELVIFWKIA